jgi:RNA polymerase sigma-70 factor (ECF subfamily)
MEKNVSPAGEGRTDISSLLEPYRRELQLHCYRLMGSLQDAEDMVQETMLRAWRRFATFTGSASLRTWLYTIATNVCLDALKKRPPRTMPVVVNPAADPRLPLAPPISEPIWLEPVPDSWLVEADNPETRYTRQESVSFAFLTALQLLPPRQRAVLILADVLDWRASEIAALLEITVSAVNSALHRARVTLAKQHHMNERAPESMRRTADPQTSALLARYVHAWETDDIAGIVALLKEDAVLSMPPFPSWYQGREAILAILAAGPFGTAARRRWKLRPTSANGQPAFVFYQAEPSQGIFHAFGVQVVTIDWLSGQIAELTIFKNPSLAPYFGSPPQLPE